MYNSKRVDGISTLRTHMHCVLISHTLRLSLFLYLSYLLTNLLFFSLSWRNGGGSGGPDGQHVADTRAALPGREPAGPAGAHTALRAAQPNLTITLTSRNAARSTRHGVRCKDMRLCTNKQLTRSIDTAGSQLLHYSTIPARILCV